LDKLIEAVKNLTEKNNSGASSSANSGASNVEQAINSSFSMAQ
jgi:hypothetical protein